MLFCPTPFSHSHVILIALVLGADRVQFRHVAVNQPPQLPVSLETLSWPISFRKHGCKSRYEYVTIEEPGQRWQSAPSTTAELGKEPAPVSFEP